MEVFDAELFAIEKAFKLALNQISLFTKDIWIFSDSQAAIQRIQKLQNQTLRKILGTFKTSLVGVMEIEASIPPLKVRFNKICKNYALRILQMHENYSIRLRVSSNFPSFINEIELN